MCFFCLGSKNACGVWNMRDICFCWCSHYIVPELGPDVKFSYESHKAVDEFKEAKAVSVLELPFFILRIVFHVLCLLEINGAHRVAITTSLDFEGFG